MSRKPVFVVAGSRMGSSNLKKPSDLLCEIEDNKDLVDTLRRKRSMIIPLMKDAEDKQFTEPSVKAWLVDLKHTIYDANTLLDRIDTEARFKERDDAHQSSHAAKQEITTSKIEEITKKLEEFVDDGRKILGLIPPNEKATDAQVCDSRITSPSWEGFDAVCARKVAEDQIMKLVFSSPEHEKNGKVDVIAIVGMGGLGKTILAKLVYHHADVKEKFWRSWACVSDRISLARVTRSILENLTGHPARFQDWPQLRRELKKELRGKRFLIVLDDLWHRSSETWQKLMAPFSGGAPGSIVIVTTRDQRVAMFANHTYELKPMSEEEGLSLFSKVVSRNHGIGRLPKMEAIGKKIVMKCGGLPLAIKTLGCLLQSDDYDRVWEDISDTSFWQLSEGRNDIVSALCLSYSYLPSHLKTCFAYCALFPQGHKFSEELVNLWIDEGFLQQQCDEKPIKGVARSCFDELASRSYFTRPYDNVDVYVMHDVMHDLARLLYKDFHLQLDGERTLNLQLDGERTLKDCKKVRHVSFHRRPHYGCKDGKGLGEMCLQTFLAHKIGWSLEDKILREFLLQQPPLRVLCLRGSGVCTLPEEIGNLELLRCLDVSYTVVATLPHSLFKLHNLRRLLCDGCDFLNEFHYEMSGLHSLRRFTLSGKHVRAPPQNLCQLRDCSVRLVFSLTLDVATAQANVSGSGYRQGGQVAMVDIDKSVFSYAVQDYDHFTRGDHSNLLESLLPHKDSEKVSIQYFNGRRFPDWVVDRSYDNIHAVELSHCRLSSGSMPLLGQMPSLKRLSICDIANMKILGREFYNCKDPFSFLEKLVFEDMKDWEEWEQSDDDFAGGICVFPRLRNLSLVNCPSLNGILPAQLPSLTELVIDGCSNLVNSCLGDNRFFKFSSLQSLLLAGSDSVESFPAEGSLPPSLTSFQIMRFTELNRLDLQNLTSLISLSISHCPKLEALSVETLPRTLKDLNLYENHPTMSTGLPKLMQHQDPLKSLKLTVGWLFGRPATFMW